MKKYDLLTPEGTRDLIFDECVARRMVENRLRGIFTQYGYSEVITPGLEFYDVFNLKARYFMQESMYKLVDGKGRLMVMRPDSTMPIARLTATRLREETFPLKLFYNQNIYRVNPKNAARDDEITQAGIEIIGGDVRRSDLEALVIAVDVLKSCESDDIRFEIGDITFFKQLMEQLDVNEDDAEEIRSYIETKNYPELNQKLDLIGNNDVTQTLKELPKLFGGVEVFEKAEKVFKDSSLKAQLSELRDVYNALCTLDIEDKITVDLGLVNKTDYYTGILFRGYIEGYGQAVISGGRYDTLIGDFGVSKMAATGFAANVNAISDSLMKNKNEALLKNADVLVYTKDAEIIDGIRHCKSLIEQGFIVDNSVCETLEEAKQYAKSKGIKQIDIIDGGLENIKSITI